MDLRVRFIQDSVNFGFSNLTFKIMMLLSRYAYTYTRLLVARIETGKVTTCNKFAMT